MAPPPDPAPIYMTLLSKELSFVDDSGGGGGVGGGGGAVEEDVAEAGGPV